MLACAGLRLAARKMTSSSSQQPPHVLQVLASSVAIANRAGQVGSKFKKSTTPLMLSILAGFLAVAGTEFFTLYSIRNTIRIQILSTP